MSFLKLYEVHSTLFNQHLFWLMKVSLRQSVEAAAAGIRIYSVIMKRVLEERNTLV